MAHANTTIANRVARLRAELKKRKLAGFIIPRQDEFQGEYVPPGAERLKWLTGFSGSWGLAILTLSKGAIFVDGRYTVQVRQQADTRHFVPHHLVDAPPAAWIEANLKKGDRLGFDPWLLTADQAKRFAEACAGKGASLVPVSRNPLDTVWKDRPPPPATPVESHPSQFAGRSAADKHRDAAKALGTADAFVLTQPDSVAWLFNIRGTDVAHTPLVLAFAILHRKGKAELFVDRRRLCEMVRAQLSRIAVVRPPDALEASLMALGRRRAKVRIDPAQTPDRIREALRKSGAEIVHGTDPCVLPKARKNRTEQEGARAAHRRDGAAMARFLHWFELQQPGPQLTELNVAAKLAAFREETGELLDHSFETIPASGPNAALPHYHARPEADRRLARNEIFLVDSGAQYRDGTTDITRTVIVGEPSADMRDRFTRVLKGMIAVSCLRFPKGTSGSNIDAFARAALWQAGLDYDHGTGHGVGSYLSVHEGPARINKSDRTALEPGMILSNEPGYYKQGHYGIRIENLLMVREPAKIAGGDRPMLSFETLTLCPIDRRLIDTTLFTRDELSWLDTYHARVAKEIGPLLQGAEARWLKKACAPLR